jgi:hypothetical protein
MVVMMEEGEKRTHLGEINEKDQTIHHKLLTHGQYFGIYPKQQNYFESYIWD